MARNDLTPGEYLQPAAGPASLSGTISGFGDAAATVVSGIRSGDIRLDVDDTEAWLTQFSELIDDVNQQRWRLYSAARQAANDTSLGSFELSDQIRAKIADRLGGARGSFAVALDEAYRGLNDIHTSLRAALATHLAADQAGADALNRIQGSAELG